MKDSYKQSLRPLIREIETDLEQRESNRAELEDAHVRVEADRRFQEWLDGMRQRFADDARREYREATPAWTFERVAELHLRSNTNLQDDARRAAHIADLTAIREENSK